MFFDFDILLNIRVILYLLYSIDDFGLIDHEIRFISSKFLFKLYKLPLMFTFISVFVGGFLDFFFRPLVLFSYRYLEELIGYWRYRSGSGSLFWSITASRRSKDDSITKLLILNLQFFKFTLFFEMFIFCFSSLETCSTLSLIKKSRIRFENR